MTGSLNYLGIGFTATAAATSVGADEVSQCPQRARHERDFAIRAAPAGLNPAALRSALSSRVTELAELDDGFPRQSTTRRMMRARLMKVGDFSPFGRA